MTSFRLPVPPPPPPPRHPLYSYYRRALLHGIRQYTYQQPYPADATLALALALALTLIPDPNPKVYIAMRRSTKAAKSPHN